MRLQLRPSYPFAAAIVAAHGAAALAVLSLMGGFYGGALGAALLALGLASAWRRALLRGPSAVRVLEISGSGLTCETARGSALVAAGPRRYVSRLLVALPAGRRTLLVTADMLEPGEFRRLRVWALWGRLPGVAGEQLAA
ncbi:MAG TPA: hypothetical protein VFI86_07365 [Burkholderiales bacterium]|nr:hypothetical protein [Burkholderiales bacterium]